MFQPDANWGLELATWLVMPSFALLIALWFELWWLTR